MNDRVYRRVRLVIVSTSWWKAKQYTQVETTANVYDVSWTLAWHCESCVSSVHVRSDILAAPMYTSIHDILLIGNIIVCVLMNRKTTMYSLKQQQMCRAFAGRWHAIANHVLLHCTYTGTEHLAIEDTSFISQVTSTIILSYTYVYAS